jgi:sulfur carrier protein
MRTERGRRPAAPNQCPGADMKVTANGRPREVAADTTVLQLLQQYGLSAQLALVEYNGEPLHRDLYASTVLRADDAVEIAQMVGGG